MSKVVQLKEKLNKKPEATKAKVILENLNKVCESYVSKEDAEKLKDFFKKNLPSGWKATYSISPWDDFVVTVNTLPIKDVKEMAYKDLEDYKRAGNGVLNRWDDLAVKQEHINFDKKQLDKQFQLKFSPKGGNAKNDLKTRLEDLRTKINPKAKISETLAKIIVEALSDGYDNSDPHSDYFDRSYSVTFKFGDEYKNKFVKLS